MNSRGGIAGLLLQPIGSLWPIYALAVIAFFVLIRLDGTAPTAFPDIVAVRCAGQLLNAGADPYSKLASVCGVEALNFYYLPVVAQLSAITVGWLGVAAWMTTFHLLYAMSFASLVVVAFGLLPRAQRHAAGLMAIGALLLLMGGGVAITGFRSGNIAVLFWGALAAAVFGLRSGRLAALIIFLGVCIKIHLVYLLVIPALMLRDLRLPLAVVAAVVLVYLAQWQLQPTLFATYLHDIGEASRIIGYAGASTLQLGVWLAQLSGFAALRVIVVLVAAALLIWRGRHVLQLFLSEAPRASGEHAEVRRIRMLALLMLGLAVMSPRVLHYELLILLPALAVLAPLPGQRVAWLLGCLVVPWIFRLALVSAHFEPLASWLLTRFGLNYNALWAYYMFGVWSCFTAYAWHALGKDSVVAVIGAPVPPAHPSA